MLGVGAKFPEFNGTSVVSCDVNTAFKPLNNKDFSGKWKVYFFWPKDFTFICPTEISSFGDANKEFQSRNCQLIGCSTDSDWVHFNWKNSHPDLKELPFPMYSDIKRDLVTALGILDERAGVAQRATFIVDPEGTIRFVSVTDLNVGRNTAEVLRVLDALQCDGLVPCNWQKGQATLNPKELAAKK